MGALLVLSVRPGLLYSRAGMETGYERANHSFLDMIAMSTANQLRTVFDTSCHRFLDDTDTGTAPSRRPCSP
ncbi:MAG: hypothetical protein KatS3mg057_0734 [Herpetosiphonaceae bacterium]|nr:MAG: hypothetical protein KatS3mg057_0734 [Herpetosiphonaceae bacterium]